MIQLLVLMAVSAVFCALVARRRGANVGLWLVLGLLLGPLAVPFVFFSRVTPQQRD
jgi:hypothetical protein